MNKKCLSLLEKVLIKLMETISNAKVEIIPVLKSRCKREFVNGVQTSG
jgi:hypothetical protein